MAVEKIIVNTKYQDTDTSDIVSLPGVIVLYGLLGQTDLSTITSNFEGTAELQIYVQADQVYSFTAIYPDGYDDPVTVNTTLSELADPKTIDLVFPSNPEDKPHLTSRNIRVEVSYLDVEGGGGETPLPLATVQYCFPFDNVEEQHELGTTNSEGIFTHSFESTEEGFYLISATYPGFGDAVSEKVNLLDSDSDPIIIKLQWQYNPTEIVQPRDEEELPYPIPSWIYEGNNSDLYEYGTGQVLNRAPKEIQKNVEALDAMVKERLKYDQMIDPKLFTLDGTYYYRDIVVDDYGVAYVCVYKGETEEEREEGITGKPLTDTTYWKRVQIAGTGTVLDVNGGFLV